MKAIATARFDGGRGIELLIHANMTMYPQYDKDIKNLSKSVIVNATVCKRGTRTYSETYRAAVFIVDIAIMKPSMPTKRGIVMW